MMSNKMKNCLLIYFIIIVIYKSPRASKSNYVKHLCLVVPLVSRLLCPYLVKAFRQRYVIPRHEGTWHSTPQADRFLPSLFQGHEGTSYSDTVHLGWSSSFLHLHTSGSASMPYFICRLFLPTLAMPMEKTSCIICLDKDQ